MSERPEPEEHQPLSSETAVVAMQSMVRRLTERNIRVHENGPTLLDILRQELRPLVKEWLDANLPSMVERLVKVEIERVVSRIE